MALLTTFAYYFLFWWICLFAVLSIGLRTQEEEGEVVPGTEASAPAKLNIGRVLLLNTVVSGILFAIWYFMFEVMGVSLEDIAKFLPQPPA